MKDNEIRREILVLFENWLNKKHLESLKINMQCQERFGVDWKEFVNHLLNSIINFELTPGRLQNPKSVAAVIRGTCDWMTAPALSLIYLSFAGHSRESLKKLQDADNKHVTDGTDFLDVAPLVCPKETKQLLAEHGLTYRSSYTKDQISTLEAKKPEGHLRKIEDFPEIDL